MRFIKVKTVDLVRVSPERNVYEGSQEDVFLNLAMVRDFRVQVRGYKKTVESEVEERYSIVFFGDVDSDAKQRQVYGPIGITPIDFASEVEALDWVFKSEEATGKKPMSNGANFLMYSYQRAGEPSFGEKTFRSIADATGHRHFSLEVTKTFYVVTRSVSGFFGEYEETVASMVDEHGRDSALADNAEHAEQMRVYEVKTMPTTVDRSKTDEAFADRVKQVGAAAFEHPLHRRGFELVAANPPELKAWMKLLDRDPKQALSWLKDIAREELHDEVPSNRSESDEDDVEDEGGTPVGV